MAHYNISLTLTSSGSQTTRNLQNGDTMTVTLSGIINTYNRALTSAGVTPGSANNQTANPVTFTANASSGNYSLFFSTGAFFPTNTFKSAGLSGALSSGSGGGGGTPSYTMTAPTSISEGSTGTVSISTSNVSNATHYWSVSPSGDFNTSTGTVSISSNSGSFTLTPASDGQAEAAETATVRLYTNSARTALVATDTFTIPASSGSSSGGGGGSTGGGTTIGTTTHGIEVFSQDGTLIFGTDLRTQNIQYFETINISSGGTSSFYSMADANDPAKTLIQILGYYPPNRFTINTSSTGFSISSNATANNTTFLALRIG